MKYDMSVDQLCNFSSIGLIENLDQHPWSNPDMLLVLVKIGDE